MAQHLKYRVDGAGHRAENVVGRYIRRGRGNILTWLLSTAPPMPIAKNLIAWLSRALVTERLRTIGSSRRRPSVSISNTLALSPPCVSICLTTYAEDWGEGGGGVGEWERGEGWQIDGEERRDEGRGIREGGWRRGRMRERERWQIDGEERKREDGGSIWIIAL